ncbi:gluconate:proton symporter [Bacteroidia bacterium]|nr:gluconate:proton symporter [Bacteroidia bacterium]
MSALGATMGLILAIILIIKKVSPVYSMILGAVVGSLAGGVSLGDTVGNMISGVRDIVPAIVRILSAGVLFGVLITTGAAESISRGIVRGLGHRNTLMAIALAAMLLTATGVFIDVAVITVAPIALMAGRKAGINRLKLLLAMVGGGKCGNIISPNPNTIIAAENFGAPLPSVMYVNIIPAIVGLMLTVWVVARLVPSGEEETAPMDNPMEEAALPPLALSIIAPLVSVILLVLRPLCGITVDPLIALPVGGLVGIVAMGRWRQVGASMTFGLQKMSVVAVLLVGTGTIAGVIKASTLKDVILGLMERGGVGNTALAPISGALMSAATASTTAGATVASASFAEAILAAGISAVWGAAMVNSGATALDHLPHGSFFHATGGAVEMTIRQRLKLIPYETAVGVILAILTVACYYVIG